MHARQAKLPLPAFAVPAGQTTGTPPGPGWYPAPGMQTVCALAGMLGDVQLRQALAPVLGWNLAPVHCEHANAPAPALAYPAGQGVGSTPGDGWLPGPGMHAVCAALGVFGGGQLMQDVDAVLGVNLAPLQNVHR